MSASAAKPTKRARLCARNVMAQDLIVLHRDMSIVEAARTLSHGRISGAPVVDDDGALVGILTEADLLLKAAGAPGGIPALEMFHLPPRAWRIRRRIRQAQGTTVGEVMTPKVITATEDASVREVAALMARHEVGRIPIVRDGRPVGIVTRNDVLLIFARRDHEIEREFRDALAERIDPAALEISVSDHCITVNGDVERQSDMRMLEVLGLSIDGVVGVDVAGVTFTISDLR